MRGKIPGKGAELWIGMGTAQMWPRCCWEGPLGTGKRGKRGKNAEKGELKVERSQKVEGDELRVTLGVQPLEMSPNSHWN